MYRFYLLDNREIQQLIDAKPKGLLEVAYTALALEVREYRKLYGPLGCEWLVKEED